MGALLQVKQSTAMQEKPLLDEESFQQLLAAAYVIQQHNESAPVEEIRPSQTTTLAEIVEIQTLIQSHQLDLPATMNLLATRAQKLTRASGAAIAVIEGDELRYCAASGSAASEGETRIPLNLSIARHCVTRRELVQSPNLETEKNFEVAKETLSRARVRSLIALPFFYDGNVVGVLELRSGHANCFQEHDVRTCQLMAGLLSEAFARNAELEWKRALAAERATMLEALEKIKPQLEKLVESPPAPKPVVAEPERSAETVTSQCRGCGNELLEEESYCGICGAARASGVQDIQSKWASMWHMQQAQQRSPRFAAEHALELTPMDVSESKSPAEPVIDVEAEPISVPHGIRITVDENPSVEGGSSPWTSAASTRRWLESQRPGREWLLHQWNFNRANIYLGVAVVLFLMVLTGLGSRSARNYFGQTASAAYSRSGKHPAPRQLSLLERAMVATGIAEAPVAPTYLGNPNAKVWVDLHTALYYCQGSDPYGNTPGGKFATQLEAQQDSFEPAFRKACE
jgi:putative methionine-R-sulfoxide reductase with GAF domain